MVLQGLGNDKYVADIRSSEVTHVLKTIIHGILKCRMGIAQSERHYLVRKSSVLRPERCAFDVFWIYPNLIES